MKREKRQSIKNLKFFFLSEPDLLFPEKSIIIILKTRSYTTIFELRTNSIETSFTDSVNVWHKSKTYQNLKIIFSALESIGIKGSNEHFNDMFHKRKKQSKIFVWKKENHFQFESTSSHSFSIWMFSTIWKNVLFDHLYNSLQILIHPVNVCVYVCVCCWFLDIFCVHLTFNIRIKNIDCWSKTILQFYIISIETFNIS